MLLVAGYGFASSDTLRPNNSFKPSPHRYGIDRKLTWAGRLNSGVGTHPGVLVAIGVRTRESKLWTVMGVMFGILRFVDFLFYGKQLHDLIAMVGFLMVAVGAFLNGFQTLEAISTSGKKTSVNAYAFALIGFALVVVSMVVKYSQ